MTDSVVVKLATMLSREIVFICESIVITDEDITPICRLSVEVSRLLTEAITNGDPDEKLQLFETARLKCIQIDDCLILMYATMVLSQETFTKLRNSYASLSRNLSRRCYCIKNRQEQKN